MATSVTWNNTSYSIPAAGELNWSTLSDFLIALGGGAGQPGAQVSGKVQKFGMRVATASPVTVSDVNDCVIVVDLTVAGASTVNLPAGVTGRVFMVVDGKGDAASNNITLDGNGSQTIQGSLTYTMNVNKSAVLLGFDGTEWKIIGAYEGASIPDSRLATISTAGKVANSATTATDANTPSAIVARDASGNFSAGTISAALSGNATTATTAANLSGSNLTGDVTNVANAMTVASVGGKTASAVAQSVTDTVAATELNTPSTIMKRDASGKVYASIFNGSLAGNATTATTAANLSGSNFTGDVTNVANAMTVANVGGKTASAVAQSVTDTVAATNANTASTIVKRDASGNFSASVISGTSLAVSTFEDLTAISTPAAPTAGKVRIYAKTDNKLYKQDSSGNEAAIGSGSGSGGVNYLVDWYDATKAVGTVSTVAVGGNVTVSGSFPAVTSAWYADSTSGSAAIASSSDNTLRGTTNYLTALSGVSTSGATFVQSPVFNIDGEDLGKALTVQFDISGVTTDDDWDVVAVRYNSSGTFQELIPIAGNVSSMTGTPSAKLPIGVKTFNGFFITGSTASDVYAIRWRRRAGSAQIRLDSLTVGPQQVLQGAIVTDWQDYTATSGWTSNTTLPTFRWRRVGQNMEIYGGLSLTGAPNATSLNFSLPTGYTVDTTKLVNYTSGAGSAVGTAVVRDSGVADYIGVAKIQSGNPNKIIFSSPAASDVWSETRPFTWGNLDTMSFQAVVPISEFASANTQQAARAVEEYAYNSDVTSTASVTASGFANGADGVGISANWTAVGTSTYTRRVRFQTPVLATDRLTVELFDTTLLQWTPSEYLFPRNVQSTLNYGIVVLGTTTVTDVDVQFMIGGSTASGSTYASNGSAWSTRTGYKWRVRKVSSGAAVGFPVGARNVIGDTTGTEVPAGYIGERKLSSASGNITLSTSIADLGLSFTLNPGEWIIGYRACCYLTNPTGAVASNFINLILTDGSNVEISGSGSQTTIENQPASSGTGVITSVQCEIPLTVSTTQTVKLRGLRANVSANTALLHDGQYRITRLYARRIA